MAEIKCPLTRNFYMENGEGLGTFILQRMIIIINDGGG